MLTISCSFVSFRDLFALQPWVSNPIDHAKNHERFTRTWKLRFATLVIVSMATVFSYSSSTAFSATLQGSNNATAERLFREAQQLLDEGTTASKYKAIDKLIEALPLWRA